MASPPKSPGERAGLAFSALRHGPLLHDLLATCWTRVSPNNFKSAFPSAPGEGAERRLDELSLSRAFRTCAGGELIRDTQANRCDMLVSGVRDGPYAPARDKKNRPRRKKPRSPGPAGP